MQRPRVLVSLSHTKISFSLQLFLVLFVLARARPDRVPLTNRREQTKIGRKHLGPATSCGFSLSAIWIQVHLFIPKERQSLEAFVRLNDIKIVRGRVSEWERDKSAPPSRYQAPLMGHSIGRQVSSTVPKGASCFKGILKGLPEHILVLWPRFQM